MGSSLTKQSLKRALVLLPISLLLLAGCGDDGATASDDSASQASGSEDASGDDASGDDGASDDASSDSGPGDSGDASSAGLDESTDLCSLVSEETLAASGLTAADGSQQNRAGEPSCMWDNLDRSISVSVDFAYTLGAIDKYSQGAEEMNGRQVQVGYDDETTCLYEFTIDDETRVRVIVEDRHTAESPGEPCDAGRPAIDDVMAAIG